MDINASIIDQQLTGLMESHSGLLPPGDEEKRRSEAFVVLCMSNCLGISIEAAFDLLTDGGNDAGVDGLSVGEVEDGEFLVSIFQGKYKRSLEGAANFPENGVKNAVNTVNVLFDPFRDVALNEMIRPQIEEIRSLIREGYIPKVRVILCNNGRQWTDSAQEWINASEGSYPNKLEFVHFNHDSIVGILQGAKPVNAALQLCGKVIVEDMNYMRVMLGKVSARQISEMFELYGDQLLQRNIRRYLGMMHGNRVNVAIHETLCSENSDKFYFYNNGITVVCDKFDYNAFQNADYIVRLENMQVINGGQTCKTIHETLKTSAGKSFDSAYVMIRIYQLSSENKDFMQEITYATNSQNPVDLWDLHSNDEVQAQLEIGMSGLGYSYKRQRDDSVSSGTAIPSLVVAESVLAIWRGRPHQAKFRRKAHFGDLYEDVFKGLNAAQAIIATLIFRSAENERKHPTSLPEPPEFLPYASHYISMLIGQMLLNGMGVNLDGLSHGNFKAAVEMLGSKQSEYYQKSVEKVKKALVACYGERPISLQQLSATFRRGDILEMLQ